MLKIPLQLRPSKRASHFIARDIVGVSVSERTPTRQSAGLFIPGAESAKWLSVIAAGQLSHHLLKLIVIPHTCMNRLPLGVLVTWPATADTDICAEDVFGSCRDQPKLDAHCIQYQCLFERLWIPLIAELDVPLTRHEFLELANPDLVYVWHPTAGLIGAEAPELLSCADLLRRPTEQFGNWNMAVAGPEFNNRLLSIRTSMPLSLDEILDSGKEDIGEAADQIQWQPDSKSGPTLNEVVSSGVNPIMSGLAKLVLSFTGRAPQTAERRTWLNDLEDWAKSRLAGVSEKTFQRRNRELVWLLEMLGTNPDQGLRYALPVDSLQSHRGRVQPGGDLTQQDVKFDLRRLGGGRPADVWDIPPTIQRELTGKYRELAEREIALGRYKRAAYVYAHLLADLTAAARALENGKHYREAAVLYRDKLKDNLAAIRCLERGGLWSEAIVLLESLRMDEQAGDLYLKLEQPGRAAECYGRVVQRYCNQGDYVSAAKVEEEKLGSPELALATLSNGFGQNQPTACLTQILRILANSGQHSQSQSWIERSRQRTTESRHLFDVLRLLSSVATDYPDQTTRHKAADTVRQVISESLAQRRPVSIPALLEPLAKLAPADRLLSRDCRRYVSWQQSQSRSPPAAFTDTG